MGLSRETQQIALFFHIEKVGGKNAQSTIKTKKYLILTEVRQSR